jgi:hypothetical protein
MSVDYRSIAGETRGERERGNSVELAGERYGNANSMDHTANPQPLAFARPGRPGRQDVLRNSEPVEAAAELAGMGLHPPNRIEAASGGDARWKLENRTEAENRRRLTGGRISRLHCFLGLIAALVHDSCGRPAPAWGLPCTLAGKHIERHRAHASCGRWAMASKSKTTTNHEEIRRWVEQHDGTPAAVKDTGGADDPGILRINFPGGAQESLEEMSWDEWFSKFEDNKLAFLYQEEKASGEDSTFFKLVKQ